MQSVIIDYLVPGAADARGGSAVPSLAGRLSAGVLVQQGPGLGPGGLMGRICLSEEVRL